MKTKLVKSVTICVAVIMLATMLMSCLSVPSVNTSTVQQQTATPTVNENNLQQYKDSCYALDYTAVARDPLTYVGKNFYFLCYVSSVRNSDSQKYYVTYAFDADKADKYIKRGTYKDYSDAGYAAADSDKCVWLLEERSESDPGYVKILEKDVIVVYGTFEGMVGTKNSLTGETGETVGLHIKHVELFTGSNNPGGANGSSTEETKPVSESDFTVTKYMYKSYFSSYCFLVFKNNSSKTVGINFNVTAYNKKNKEIGAESGETDVIGPGEETIGYVMFYNVKSIHHVSYTLTFNETPYYESAISDLQVKQSKNKKNVVVSITNKGEEPAQFVKAYALFFNKKGKVIGFDWSYLTDSDNEIKSGAKRSKSLSCYKTFKKAKVYVAGYRPL